MILEKLVFTVFFILLNLFIYFLVKKKINLNWKFVIGIMALVAIFLYCYSIGTESDFFKQVLIFGSLYSLGLLILHYMFKVIETVMQSRFEKLESNFTKGFLSVLNFIKYRLIFILITIFQIMLIWYPALLEKMEV